MLDGTLPNPAVESFLAVGHFDLHTHGVGRPAPDSHGRAHIDVPEPEPGQSPHDGAVRDDGDDRAAQTQLRICERLQRSTSVSLPQLPLLTQPRAQAGVALIRTHVLNNAIPIPSASASETGTRGPRASTGLARRLLGIQVARLACGPRFAARVPGGRVADLHLAQGDVNATDLDVGQAAPVAVDPVGSGIVEQGDPLVQDEPLQRIPRIRGAALPQPAVMGHLWGVDAEQAHPDALTSAVQSGESVAIRHVSDRQRLCAGRRLRRVTSGEQDGQALWPEPPIPTESLVLEVASSGGLVVGCGLELAAVQ